MTLQVVVLTALVRPPLYVECTGRTVTLGRAETADVRLPDPTVSQRHATLKKRGRDYLVTDEGSTNGTALLAGAGSTPVWLAKGSARLVPPGGRLLLGQVEVELRMDGTAEGLPSDDLARDLVTTGLSSLGLELTEERLEAALLELTSAADEPVAPAREAVPPGPERAADDVIVEGRERSVTDWTIAALGFSLLLASAGALYWLLR